MAISIKRKDFGQIRCNCLDYLFFGADVLVENDEDDSLWELHYRDNQIFIKQLKTTYEDNMVFFTGGNSFLIASFDDDGEFTVDTGISIFRAEYHHIVNKNVMGDFLRDSISKNKCLYKLFFFDSVFAERVSRIRRNTIDNVTANVIENILNNGLITLEKVFTGCSMSFFIENICKKNMELQNDKKKLRQVLGLPTVVIDFLKKDYYASLYGEFKNLAESKDINDTVFLVEYMNLVSDVENKTNLYTSGSKSEFVKNVIQIALMTKSSMKVIINYLHNQMFYTSLGNYGIRMPISEAIAMRDYLNIAKKYNLDVDPLPSNLRAAHFYIQNNVCYADDEKKNEEFKKAVEKYKDLEYKGKTYSVIAPSSISDMIEEGMQMHHCIANYVDLVCRGTIVLFLRKTEALEESFISFEVSADGEFVQIKGKYDVDIVETEDDSENNDVLKFLTKWREKKYEEVYGS